MQITLDKKTKELIQKLQEQYGEIIFYQSFGCCEGSIPLCYAKNDFKLGQNDICLGKNKYMAFYVHKSQVPYYKDLSLSISTKKDNGNEYSLEYGMGESFVFDFHSA